MENNIQGFKRWIMASFQFITVGILVLLLILVLKQQKDINDLKGKIADTESSIRSAESTLSSQIEAVRRAVIIWSN